jgi:hypothetical protein
VFSRFGGAIAEAFSSLFIYGVDLLSQTRLSICLVRTIRIVSTTDDRRVIVSVSPVRNRSGWNNGAALWAQVDCEDRQEAKGKPEGLSSSCVPHEQTEGDPVQILLAGSAEAEAHMAQGSILERIRLLIPRELDAHYHAICRAFEEDDLTDPSLSISQWELTRAISEFTEYPPNEASIATLEKRLNPKY